MSQATDPTQPTDPDPRPLLLKLPIKFKAKLVCDVCKTQRELTLHPCLCGARGKFRWTEIKEIS